MSVVTLLLSACGAFAYAFVKALQELRELRRNHLAIRAQLDSAERLLSRRGELAHEVAHEIKNPITAILCSAETLDLLIGEKIDPEHRKSLRYIAEYGDHVLRILSDYIDVSRVEAGLLQPKPERTDVGAAITGVIGLLRSFAHARGVDVRVVDSSDRLWAMADPRLLKQIVFNLLHNAIKFTPERGCVEVQTRFDASTENIIVEVADSGPGIAPPLLKSLFDPYALERRRRESGFHDGEGYGLGLALVKLLAEASGGQVIADSTLGVGSRFAVMLPSAERPESHVEGAGQQVGMPPLVQKPLLGQSFLIVDGDRRSPEAIARLIEAWGGMVDRVGEAADAIQALSERRYDAVMIDDPADGEEGSELARVLRDEDGAEHTTIIIASVDPIPADVAAASGADRCLAKPFTGHMLLESLLKATKAAITH